jgi:curli production assembly/transport component CsgG/holdfast attachment protein HfaB
MTDHRNALMRTVRLPALVLAGAFALTACVSPVAGPSTGLYARPIGSAPVTANPTPYSAALNCIGQYALANGLRTPRIAVGRIIDYTGKNDAEGGRRITQGASLMAISAFAKTGARMVERFDTSVAELELRYANNRLIGDEGDEEFRRILAGSVPGSDFYLVGGITEMNYNIRSVGADGFFGDVDPDNAKGTSGAKLYVMNVGMDLRLVDTRTLEVVDVVSYQKQIVGREISLGVFSFWDDVVIDVGIGERAQEPIQLAVRSIVERAVIEIMANLYGVSGPSVCTEAMGSDPIGSGRTFGATGGFVPVHGTEDNNAATRAEPNRWNERRDEDVRASNLRGRQF